MLMLMLMSRILTNLTNVILIMIITTVTRLSSAYPKIHKFTNSNKKTFQNFCKELMSFNHSLGYTNNNLYLMEEGINQNQNIKKKNHHKHKLKINNINKIKTIKTHRLKS